MADAESTSPGGALGREVEHMARRLERVEQLLRVLSQEVTTLGEVIQPAEPDPPVVRAWLLAEDTGQARDDLADLVGWLERVYLRYPDAALVSCWLWHPAVVEELWWLRCAHQDAYDGPHGSYTKAGDWHDRQRPGVAGRIRRWLRDCELSRHGPGLPARMVPLPGSAGRIADAWSTTRTSPQPTPGELTDAERHDHTEHRTSYQ